MITKHPARRLHRSSIVDNGWAIGRNVFETLCQSLQDQQTRLDMRFQILACGYAREDAPRLATGVLSETYSVTFRRDRAASGVTAKRRCRPLRQECRWSRISVGRFRPFRGQRVRACRRWSVVALKCRFSAPVVSHLPLAARRLGTTCWHRSRNGVFLRRELCGWRRAALPGHLLLRPFGGPGISQACWETPARLPRARGAGVQWAHSIAEQSTTPLERCRPSPRQAG